MRSYIGIANNKVYIVLVLVMTSGYLQAFQSQDLFRRRVFKVAQFEQDLLLQMSLSNSTHVDLSHKKEASGNDRSLGSVSAPPRYKKHVHRRKSKKLTKQRRKELALANRPRSSTSTSTESQHEDESSHGFSVDAKIEFETDEIDSEFRSYTWLQNHPALLLNADYQPMSNLPLSLWTWQDAVKAVFSGKVTVVDVYPDVYVRAANIKMPLPAVIALSEYAPHARGQRPAFTRKNVFLRDRYRCQYCNNEFRAYELTLDHVKPRCLGGRLNWENAVTCCTKCNSKKGSLQVHELKSVGMSLVREPRVPSSLELAQLAEQIMPRKVHSTWIPYLSFLKKTLTSTNRVEVGVGVGVDGNNMNEMEE